MHESELRPTNRADLSGLVFLGALWGGSFLFLRIAVPHFGPVALIFTRTTIGWLVLLPLVVSRARISWRQAMHIFVVGVTNTAIPFTLLAYGTLSLSAGFSSILNSAAPVFTAAISWIWLGQKASASRAMGLLIGISGILILVWDKLSFHAGGEGLAVLAIVLGTVCYGIAGNYTRKYLQGVNSMWIAFGSQLGASLFLLFPALSYWPSEAPSAKVWAAAISLGVFCTGLAYVIYFWLLENLGPTRAIAVTYLVPIFGVLWGCIFLGEALNTRMLLGAAVILTGTAITMGFSLRNLLFVRVRQRKR